jgi:predicted dehydrogenase
MAKVRVGLIACGFVAELHMYAYKRVYGVDVEVAAVAARGDHVIEFAKKHRIPATYRDFRAVLADKTIDVVDICTPPRHARDDDRRSGSSRKARHLREAVHRIFRAP